MKSNFSAHKTIKTQLNECQTVHDSTIKETNFFTEFIKFCSIGTTILNSVNQQSTLEETNFFTEFLKFCSIGTTILIYANKETTKCVLHLLSI